MCKEKPETNETATSKALPGSSCSALRHYRLFKHMADVYGLILIDDELEQIALSVADERKHYWESLSDSIGHFSRAATERTGAVQTGIEMRETAQKLSKLYFQNSKD